MQLRFNFFVKTCFVTLNFLSSVDNYQQRKKKKTKMWKIFVTIFTISGLTLINRNIQVNGVSVMFGIFISGKGFYGKRRKRNAK